MFNAEGRTDRQAGRQARTTKLIVTFRNFANAHKCHYKDRSKIRLHILVCASILYCLQMVGYEYHSDAVLEITSEECDELRLFI